MMSTTVEISLHNKANNTQLFAVHNVSQGPCSGHSKGNIYSVAFKQISVYQHRPTRKAMDWTLEVKTKAWTLEAEVKATVWAQTSGPNEKQLIDYM